MIAALASGTGSNLEALLSHNIPIDLVASDKPNCNALKVASNYGVSNIISYRKLTQLEKELGKYDYKLIILAGFMRILSPWFVQKYNIINIHPSLLPHFPGLYAIEQALDAGVSHTGVTIHYVNEGVDTGKVISQRSCFIDPEDTVATLQAKLQKIEHKMYPEVISRCLK
jgi:phosphoribosylglycinamide formyltransferase-1|tara:strand:+ start:131 stop:640 length:510 start_codon:yes stop_codon:yes gene_type:complete